MMKLVLSILAVVAAVCAWQPRPNAPTPCCGPKQFMAGNGATVGQADPTRGPEGFFTYQYGAFDFSKREFGYDMFISYPDGNSSSLRIVQKYAQDSQWIIIDSIKYCVKQPAQKPEPNVCIPPNATYVTSAVIGGMEGGKWVDTWTYYFQRPRDPINAQLSVNVFQDKCLPFSASVIGSRFNGPTEIPFVSAGGSMNLSLGIPDPDRWFSLPSYCNQEDNIQSSRKARSVPFLDHFNFPKFF